jgi:phage gpG-like protein
MDCCKKNKQQGVLSCCRIPRLSLTLLAPPSGSSFLNCGAKIQKNKYRTMDIKYFAQHIQAIKEEIERFVSDDAPDIIGKEAVDHYTENFQEEGFVNGGLQKWQEVKRRMNPKITGVASERAILTGNTGDLGRSINYEDAGNGTVIIYSDLKYSAAHNEGTTTAGKNHSTVIPQRQFIGESQELSEKIIEILEQKIGDVFG